MPYRVRPNLKIGGVSWPLFAVVGGHRHRARLARRRRPGRADAVCRVRVARRRASSSTSSTAGGSGSRCARRCVAPLQFGPAVALEYRSILVPIVSGPEAHEAIDLAARLAAERGATIVALRVIVVPLDRPIDAEMAAEEAEADRLLDEARLAAVGLRRAHDRPHRASRATPAARSSRRPQRRQSEIVVLGAPRRPPPRDLRQDRRLRPQERALPRHGRRREEGRMSRARAHLAPDRTAVHVPAGAWSARRVTQVLVARHGGARARAARADARRRRRCRSGSSLGLLFLRRSAAGRLYLAPEGGVR